MTFCSIVGIDETEIEDLYDKEIYRDAFREKFGVDITIKLPGKRKKWSDQTSKLFAKSGKPWNKSIKVEVKGGWLILPPKIHMRSFINLLVLSSGHWLKISLKKSRNRFIDTIWDARNTDFVWTSYKRNSIKLPLPLTPEPQ